MAKRKSDNRKPDVAEHYRRRVQPMVAGARWILRVTEWRDRPPPVFVVKHRLGPDEPEPANGRTVVIQRGAMYGAAQRRCLPVVGAIVARVCDPAGVALELERFLAGERIGFRGNLPLDEEAGYKLALIFKLQERVKDLDRVELIARRIDRFTREESAYWYSRIAHFQPSANRWAVAGMKIMLGGHPRDRAVERMLEESRRAY